MKKIILLIAILIPCSSFAQEDTTYFDISSFLMLDSVVVSAKRGGFSVDEFVNMVMVDSSFHQAFRNLRFHGYEASNDFHFFDKKDKEVASYFSRSTQKVKDGCRTMTERDKKIKGKYFKKNGKPYYYTTKMFEKLFFTKGKKCESRTDIPVKPKGPIDKNIAELKTLIFNPGRKINVPLIGGKTAIFDEKMVPFYDYAITSGQYKDIANCYIFSAKVKPEFQEKKEGKTVIKYLITYFDKSNFQVIARDYQLSYFGTLFDFDVTMNIELTKIGEDYIPEKIVYDGFWKIPTKKRETAKFTLLFNHFKS